MAAAKRRWVALGYNLPVNPSKNRVYVWRKLKDFGAAYFKQGVAVLPMGKDKIAQFTALSQRVKEMGGEASLIEIVFIDPNDELELIAKFKQQSQSEYFEMLEIYQRLRSDLECDSNLRENLMNNSDRIRSVFKQYMRMRSRQHFKISMNEDLEKGLGEISDMLKVSANEISEKLRKMLDA